MNEPFLARILRYSTYIIAFAVPLIIFKNYISPFHFGKVIVFRIAIEILIAFYVLLIWQDRRYLPKFNKIFWSFLAFAAAFSVATIFSSQIYPSFWGGLERMGGLFSFWHYFIYFLILTSVLKTKDHWDKFLKFIILSGVLSAFYGFGQKTNIEFFIGSGGRERIFGTIGNAALFAGYQLLTLFLALTLFFKKSQNKKYYLLVIAGINTVAVILTAVRGSLLALAIGFLLFTLLYARQFKSRKAFKLMIAMIVFGVLGFIFSVSFKDSSVVQNNRYLRRVTDVSLSSFTVKTRFWAWEAGFKGWSESPKTVILGWGPENFNIPFSQNFNPKFFTGPGAETLFDRAHNMFVEILVTMGLIGLAAYIFIFYAIFSSLNKMVREKPETGIYFVGFVSLVVAYIIHNSFIFDTSANFLTFFSILGFINYLAYADSPATAKNREFIKSGIPALRSSVVLVILILGIFGAYKLNILPAKANYATTRAIVRGWSNDFKGAVEKYHEAVSYDVMGKYDYRHRFAQYVLEQANGQKITPELEDILTAAMTEVQKNVDENPLDYLPNLYMSRLHIVLGKDNPLSSHNDKALEYSMKALELAPKFVRTYFEIAQGYLNKNDTAKAMEYFQKAADLNPEAGISYWYLGLVEIENGNLEKGLSLIEKGKQYGYEPSVQDNLRLVNWYAQRNDMPKVIEIYESLIKQNPNNAQYYASLAVAYARVGRIDDAVRAAQETVRIDPEEYTQQAANFIKSLGR